VSERNFLTVTIWQCYKQERDCLMHFLRLSAVWCVGQAHRCPPPFLPLWAITRMPGLAQILSPKVLLPPGPGPHIIRGCLAPSTPQSLHSFIPGLKPFSFANPSHRSLPFLLQDWLGPTWFPGLFTDTSEHIHLLLFYFFCFPLFSCWFREVGYADSCRLLSAR